jgi:hypothetical protein
MRASARTFLAAIFALALLASTASAAGRYDLKGKWHVGGTGGSASGDLTITSMNRATGAFSGTSFGGRFKVKGTETGTSVTFTQSGGGYVSTATGTVSAGGKHMSGTWHDSNGAGGTWFGNKAAAHKHPKHKHKKHKHKRHKHKRGKHKRGH